MEASGLQAAFSEATAGLDAVRTLPAMLLPAPLPPFDYRGAARVLSTVRLAPPSGASADNPSRRQRVSPLVTRTARTQLLAEPAKSTLRGLTHAASRPAPLPADPVMSAHAASVDQFDLATFRRALAEDVRERIRTAPIRPLPTIRPPGPRQASRPAHSIPSVAADSGAQYGPTGSLVSGDPPQHAARRQQNGLHRRASDLVCLGWPWCTCCDRLHDSDLSCEHHF